MATGLTSLNALYRAFGDLRRALDDNDVNAIHEATNAIKLAADDVRAQGAWKMDPALAEKLDTLRPVIEAARVRVNLATDDVRQRLARLAQNGAGGTSATYGR